MAAYDPNKIEILRGLEPIRRRPTLYVGPLDDPALPAKLLMQALCHAADRAVDGGCTRAELQLDGPSARVSYDAGMPLEEDPTEGKPGVVIILTILTACHSRKRHSHVGDELCELGLAVLNALCESLLVTTNASGRSATFRFEKGELVGVSPIVATLEPDRTQMSLRLDRSILGENGCFQPEAVRQAVARVEGLLPSLHIDVGHGAEGDCRHA